MKKEIRKVALDIGNNEIKLLVGEMSPSFDKISVKNYVKVKSRGIRKSTIEDSEALAESIQEAIDKIQKIDFPIEKLSLALGGAGVTSTTVNVKISFPEKVIDQEDINALLVQAKKKIFGGREALYRVLYKEIYNKRVDGPGIVKQPIGMIAKEIQADVHLVYVEDSYVEKFIEVINKVGVDVDRVYLSSYASAKGTLDEETRKMGVAHVDIGYASTDIILLKNGKVLYAKTIPLGEMHYISDMTHTSSLGLSKEAAEEVLNKFKNKEIENDNTIKYGAKKISLRDIRDVIQDRTGDIISFITGTIEASGFNGHLAKGIVLTGGTVAIDGVTEQIASRSGYLVRRMLPIEIKGLEDVYYSDAVAVGIFLEDMEREYRAYTERKLNPILEEEEVEEEEKVEENQEFDEDFLEEETEDENESLLKKILKGILDIF